jgi:hypothetical protein
MATFNGQKSPLLSSDIAGLPAAWGDFAEASVPMLGNLFGVFVKIPVAVGGVIGSTRSIISMLASAVVLPQEAVMIEPVATKLSDYDVVVGKERGELSLTFNEQQGAPVSHIMSAWHSKIVDARGAGIGFPDDFAATIWVAALSGNGAPYYWWMFTRAFPKMRGNNPTFGNDQKAAVQIEVPFSYLQMFDGAEALAGAGANFAINLQNAATKLGL